MSYLSVGKQQLITVLLAEIVIKAPSISKGECCFQIFERFGMLLPKIQYLKHLSYPVWGSMGGGQGGEQILLLLLPGRLLLFQ